MLFFVLNSLTSSSVLPVILLICTSENPLFFAFTTDSFVNFISLPLSQIFFTFSKNHWLIPVSLWICFVVMPSSIASLIYIILLCVGTFRLWIISFLFAHILSLGS